MDLDGITRHWGWLSPIVAAILAWISRHRIGGLWRWVVKQTTLNRDNTDLQEQVRERTRERDEARKGRDDAFQMISLLRRALEDLGESAAMLRAASTLVDSESLPNPLRDTPPISGTLPPGSSPSPPIQMPPRS